MIKYKSQYIDYLTFGKIELFFIHPYFIIYFSRYNTLVYIYDKIILFWITALC